MFRILKFLCSHIAAEQNAIGGSCDSSPGCGGLVFEWFITCFMVDSALNPATSHYIIYPILITNDYIMVFLCDTIIIMNDIIFSDE